MRWRCSFDQASSSLTHAGTVTATCVSNLARCGCKREVTSIARCVTVAKRLRERETERPISIRPLVCRCAPITESTLVRHFDLSVDADGYRRLPRLVAAERLEWLRRPPRVSCHALPTPEPLARAHLTRGGTPRRPTAAQVANFVGALAQRALDRSNRRDRRVATW